jgi:hypothetical protein
MAQIIGGLIYKIFPELRELEQKAEQALSVYKEIVDTTKSIGDYVTKNGPTIISRIEEGFGGVIKEIRDDFQKNVTISPTILKPFKAYSPGNGKGYGQGTGSAKASGTAPKPAPKPAPAPASAPASAPKPASAYAPKATSKPAQNPAGTYQPTGKTITETKEFDPVIREPMFDNQKIKKPVEKQTTLDEIVNEFKGKLKQFNTGYDANVYVYDRESVLKSYKSVATKPKVVSQEKPKVVAQEKPVIRQEKSISDQKYLEDSIRITEMYNQGYNTTWIINESAKRGYEGVRNRTDITDRVALSLDAGFAYTRGKYDSTIATKLGAKEQIINDYLSGKSYKEIKDNLKNKTNGMTISDSSILRTMHKYEKQSRKKLVRKRNGKASRKRK